MLPESPREDWMRPQPHSSSCIIPAVATEPTPNTHNTQFSPNSPNCQPRVGIWERLANKPKHYYEIWCKTYTIPTTVCKYFFFPPVLRHAPLYTGWARAKSFLWRDVQGYLMEFIFQFSSWFASFVRITSQVEKLYQTRVELWWLS